jgi:putative transposase
MPRLARVDIGDEIYHVLNRANGRSRIFESDQDYRLFEEILTGVVEKTSIRILAYCIMPNHWHLVLHPHRDKDLGTFMHLLTNAHTRKVRTRTKTIGYGHLYQGRYKSFLVQEDIHLLTLIKYVERNPLRATLVRSADQWKWGSAWRRLHGSPAQKALITPSPTPLPQKYLSWLNTPDTDDELTTLRTSVNKGVPFGSDTWTARMIDEYDLGTTTRGPGRPKKS